MALPGLDLLHRVSLRPRKSRRTTDESAPDPSSPTTDSSTSPAERPLYGPELPSTAELTHALSKTGESNSAPAERDPKDPTARKADAGDEGGPMVPIRLRWALVTCWMYHGGLLLFRSYENTYDAYVHIFLGDHYARDWFSTWEQRWYTGFTTVSYPPGTHMATGALSKVTGDLELSFAFLQLCALSLLTVGVYRFSRMWVGKEQAASASLLLVFSSAIAETVHLFGQLPTTWALAFLLNALPFMKKWAFEGRLVDLVSGTAVLAACTAGHHVTTLFGSVFFLGPVLAHGLLEESRRARDDETAAGRQSFGPRTALPLVARRLRRGLPALFRVGILGFAVLGALVIVVLPYWWWSATDPITQVSIPHGSRNNFLVDRNIGLIFFVIPWGMMIFVLPYAMIRLLLDRKWPLAASIFLLFVLGTGGTTPIPKMLLGGAFDVLTLDRFTFWASMQILPVAGVFVHSLEKGSIAKWMRSTGGPVLMRTVQIGFVLSIVGLSLFSSSLSQFRAFQPQRIDPDPIVAFLEKDEHDRWRYLTLGFGDQMAWLSANTTATQVDGNYHSARRLPELTSTSVERLEGAKYRGISGLGSLQQFLEVPEKYNLKFVFSNDQFYDPVLHFSGWQRIGQLDGAIAIWERADIPPLPAQLPTREVPKWQRIMWGTVPPTAIVSAIFILIWNLLGRPGLRAEFDTARANRRVIRGPVAWLDRILWWLQKGLSDQGRPEPTGPPWNERVLALVQRRLSRRVGAPRRIARLLLLVLLVGYFPVRAAFTVTTPPTATEVVETYYDDLDFRRWEQAYNALDPITKPDWELWRLQSSVKGGMLASYVKLDRLNVEVIEEITPDRLVVKADLTYISSLDWYEVERTHIVQQRDGQWFIQADEPDVTVPPDQLVRRADIEYVIQGRRRVTSGTTELTDVQDRPEMFIRSVDLLEVDGQPVMVGEVMNLDVDPGDITITGVLRNADDEIIGRYNATEQVIHAIRPRESTPFLIRFEEVAAGTNMEFDPLDFTPLQLDETVATAEVYAKAVVTTGGLYRGLGVANAEVTVDDDGGHRLVGALRNDGVDEAVIPRMLLSFLDGDGRVLWVQNAYLEYSIRSQRTGTFDIPLDDIGDHVTSNIEVKEYHNGMAPSTGQLGQLPSLIEAPPGLPYESIRVDLSTFIG